MRWLWFRLRLGMMGVSDLVERLWLLVEVRRRGVRLWRGPVLVRGRPAAVTVARLSGFWIGDSRLRSARAPSVVDFGRHGDARAPKLPPAGRTPNQDLRSVRSSGALGWWGAIRGGPRRSQARFRAPTRIACVFRAPGFARSRLGFGSWRSPGRLCCFQAPGFARSRVLGFRLLALPGRLCWIRAPGFARSRLGLAPGVARSPVCFGFLASPGCCQVDGTSISSSQATSAPRLIAPLWRASS